MNAEKAHALYKGYTDQFTRYTTEHPKGEHVVPTSPVGISEYRFYGPDALASFLTFVLRKEKTE